MLPEACALLRNLVLNSDNSIRATFAVQSSRKNATQFNALDKFEVRFIWDRKTDPAKMAYEVAKTEVHDVDRWDEAAQKVVKEKVPGPLFGWADDYA
jgi:hypothetical protein